VNVVEVSIDIHRSPGKGDHTGTELVLKIFKVGNQEGLGVWADLVHNAVVFAENELELIVVRFKFVFLKENNLGGLWDFDTNAGKALGFANEGQDFAIEVNIQLVVVGVTNDKGGLETNFGLLNLVYPLGTPERFESDQRVSDFVVLF
jgi:hypothetical protein